MAASLTWGTAERHRVAAEMTELRRAAGATAYPVDVGLIFDELGIPRPKPSAGEDWSDFLNKKAELSDDEVAAFGRAIEGCIDPETGESFLDFSVDPRRLRFNAAHEAMHWYLEHTKVCRPGVRVPPRVRDLFELEADGNAAELLMPMRAVLRMLRLGPRLKDRVELDDVHRIAHKFGVTSYTAMRRVVELWPAPVAALRIELPRHYRGDSPRLVNVTGRVSDGWRRGGYRVVPQFEHLSAMEGVGFRAFLVLTNRRDVGEGLRALNQALRWQFGCVVESYASKRSNAIHVFMS